MIRRFQPRAVPPPASPFAAVVLDDDYAHLSGLVAADFPEGRSALGDTAAEARAVLRAVARILDELGLGMDRVVRADVHLADIGDLEAVDAAWREFFPDGGEPARTATESPRLYGGSRVEITCVARR